jgi:hypothetical protein
MQNERNDDHTSDLIDLGAASEETRAMTFGADDHKAGLWLMAGLSLD